MVINFIQPDVNDSNTAPNTEKIDNQLAGKNHLKKGDQIMQNGISASVD